jgi:hypothetical protein
MHSFNKNKNLYPSIFPPNSFLTSSFPKPLSYPFPFGSTIQFQTSNFYLNSKCHGDWKSHFPLFILVQSNFQNLAWIWHITSRLTSHMLHEPLLICWSFVENWKIFLCKNTYYRFFDMNVCFCWHSF